MFFFEILDVSSFLQIIRFDEDQFRSGVVLMEDCSFLWDFSREFLSWNEDRKMAFHEVYLFNEMAYGRISCLVDEHRVWDTEE